MLRQKAGLRDDGDAINFNKEQLSEIITEIEKFILDRVDGINALSGGEISENIEDIKNEMDEFFDTWQKFVDECNEGDEVKTLHFGRRYMVAPPTEGGRRLLRQYNSQGKDVALDTLTSMRNVDVSVQGNIVIWGDDND